MNNIMGDITYNTLGIIKPELYLVVTSLLLLVYGVYRQPKATAEFIWAGLIVLGLTTYVLVTNIPAEPWTALNGMFISDYFTVASKLIILAASAITLLIASKWLQSGEGKPFETIILILLSTLGMMLMVSAADFLALYMALELSSLALYVLASINRDHAKSAEAGLKYFVLGALASGMLLFGISLIYGFTGTIRFNILGDILAGGEVSKAAITGMILVIIGFCFKLSAAPFHMWSPDVYEGAPTPITAFFSTAPKVAALALFTQLLLGPFAGVIDQWHQVLILIAVLSMLVGAFAAIVQTNFKRLLAYSSIGHVGFMLLGVIAANQSGVQAILIYVALYIFMSAGAFACILTLDSDGKPSEEIKDLKGLAQYQPIKAALIALFMFAMAGIPPLSGFFAKFYIIIATVNAGLIWLAVVGVVTSVISAYYYLKIVKIMYFDDAKIQLEHNSDTQLTLGLIITAFITACFFLLPSPLLEHTLLAAKVLIP